MNCSGIQSQIYNAMVKELSLHSWRTQSSFKPGQKESIAARSQWDTQLDRAVATSALCCRKILMRWQFSDGDLMQNGHASGLQRPNQKPQNIAYTHQRGLTFSRNSEVHILSTEHDFNILFNLTLSTCLWYQWHHFVHRNRFVSYYVDCNSHRNKAFYFSKQSS